MTSSPEFNQSEEPPVGVIQPYFDLSTGQLIVGQAALETHFNSGGNPLDTIPLRQLLQREDSNIRSDSYTHLDVNDWNNRDYLSYGHWLRSLLAVPDKKRTVLSEEVFTKSYFLGLGPGAHRVKSPQRFGSLTKFYYALGELPARESGRYDDWTKSNYADYVEKIFLELLRKRDADGNTRPFSLADEINRRSKSGEGPSVWRMSEDAGRIMHLLSLKGYADVRRWEERDYIDWGVRFMFANEGRVPNTTTMDFLAKTRRGPTSKSVYMRAGRSIPKYQQTVEEEYESELIRRDTERESKLEDIHEAFEDESLPVELFSGCRSEDQLISSIAKYRTFLKFFPELRDGHRLQEVIFFQPNNFVQAIRSINSAITGGDIEEAALMLGVFDDIWPFDDYLKHLKVA